MGIHRLVWAVSALLVAVGVSAWAASSSQQNELVKKLLTETEKSQQAWLNGNSAPAAEGMSHTSDFTIFGPFGGPPPPDGWSEQGAKAQAAAASAFKGGSTQIELVQSHVTDDLIVLVTIERNQVNFQGYDGPQDWNLRVTQVYRKDDKGQWRVVHRHADPLLARRNLAQTLRLMKP